MEIILKHIPKVINHNMNEAMEKIFIKEKVKKAIFMMDKYKAPIMSPICKVLIIFGFKEISSSTSQEWMFQHMKWKKNIMPIVLTGYTTYSWQEMRKLWHLEVCLSNQFSNIVCARESRILFPVDSWKGHVLPLRMCNDYLVNVALFYIQLGAFYCNKPFIVSFTWRLVSYSNYETLGLFQQDRSNLIINYSNNDVKMITRKLLIVNAILVTIYRTLHISCLDECNIGINGPH